MDVPVPQISQCAWDKRGQNMLCQHMTGLYYMFAHDAAEIHIYRLVLDNNCSSCCLETQPPPLKHQPTDSSMFLLDGMHMLSCM